jgi:hypothetical protein
LKDVIGYEGRYAVTTCGKVWSYKNKKFLEVVTHLNGYQFISLCKDGEVKQHSIHRLVAITYIDNHENKPQVNHKDGVKSHNHKQNLEWCTSKENHSHAHKSGLRDYANKVAATTLRKTTLEFRCKAVLQIDRFTDKVIQEWQSSMEAQSNLGICHSNILKVCNGKRKTAGGFKWIYKN